MTPIISATGLSKRYFLRKSSGRNEWITAGVARGAAAVVQRILMPWRKRGPKPEMTELWSLDDVSFDVSRGEADGQAGRCADPPELDRLNEQVDARAVVRRYDP